MPSLPRTIVTLWQLVNGWPDFRLSGACAKGSPLLYVVVADSLLRMLIRAVPGTMVRGFADDTAMTLPSRANG